MTSVPSNQRAQLERWVAIWRAAAPVLDRQKRDELEQLDTATALAQLEAAFARALEQFPIPDTSGLVEQQQYFLRLSR